MKFLVLLLSLLAIYRAKGKVTLALVAAVLLSLFSFLNFGSFHLPRKEMVHYWDAFHYYIGAKYFKELGYSSLYNSTYIAGKEKGLFQGINLVRELNTYEIISVKLIDPDKVKRRFSKGRWEEFSNDIAFFAKESDRPDSAWQKLLVDHGFNAPPFKTAAMSFILNLYPLNSFTLGLTVSFDYLMIIATILAAGILIGWYEACVFTIVFSLNPIAPFDYTFGSVMRYDWFFFLGLSIFAAYRERFLATGLLLALSTHCRIFPILFAVAFTLALLNRRTNLIRFISAYTLTGIVCFVISLIFVDNIGVMKEYSSRMSVHSEKVFSNTVGMRQIMLADHAILPEEVSQEELGSHINQRRTLTSLIAVLISAFSLLIIKGKDIYRSLPAGMLLIFCLINPVNYYYAFLAFLSLRNAPYFLLVIFALGEIALEYEANLLIQNIYFSILVFLLIVPIVIQSRSKNIAAPSKSP